MGSGPSSPVLCHRSAVDRFGDQASPDLLGLCDVDDREGHRQPGIVDKPVAIGAIGRDGEGGEVAASLSDRWLMPVETDRGGVVGEFTVSEFHDGGSELADEFGW